MHQFHLYKDELARPSLAAKLLGRPGPDAAIRDASNTVIPPRHFVRSKFESQCPLFTLILRTRNLDSLASLLSGYDALSIRENFTIEALETGGGQPVSVLLLRICPDLVEPTYGRQIEFQRADRGY